jgi:hypothetical protein
MHKESASRLFDKEPNSRLVMKENQDTTKPLEIFCQKMLKHVNSETYRNFFQGLLADLTNDNFLGDTTLQPMLSKYQDSYVVISRNVVPGESQVCQIASNNGNYVTCKLGFKNSTVLCHLDKDPLTYAELYSELEIKDISALRVKFFRDIENNK